MSPTVRDSVPPALGRHSPLSLGCREKALVAPATPEQVPAWPHLEAEWS